MRLKNNLKSFARAIGKTIKKYKSEISNKVNSFLSESISNIDEEYNLNKDSAKEKIESIRSEILELDKDAKESYLNDIKVITPKSIHPRNSHYLPCTGYNKSFYPGEDADNPDHSNCDDYWIFSADPEVRPVTEVDLNPYGNEEFVKNKYNQFVDDSGTVQNITEKQYIRKKNGLYCTYTTGFPNVLLGYSGSDSESEMYFGLKEIYFKYNESRLISGSTVYKSSTLYVAKKDTINNVFLDNISFSKNVVVNVTPKSTIFTDASEDFYSIEINFSIDITKCFDFDTKNIIVFKNKNNDNVAYISIIQLSCFSGIEFYNGDLIEKNNCVIPYYILSNNTSTETISNETQSLQFSVNITSENENIERNDIKIYLDKNTYTKYISSIEVSNFTKISDSEFNAVIDVNINSSQNINGQCGIFVLYIEKYGNVISFPFPVLYKIEGSTSTSVDFIKYATNQNDDDELNTGIYVDYNGIVDASDSNLSKNGSTTGSLILFSTIDPSFTKLNNVSLNIPGEKLLKKNENTQSFKYCVCISYTNSSVGFNIIKQESIYYNVSTIDIRHTNNTVNINENLGTDSASIITIDRSNNEKEKSIYVLNSPQLDTSNNESITTLITSYPNITISEVSSGTSSKYDDELDETIITDYKKINISSNYSDKDIVHHSIIITTLKINGSIISSYASDVFDSNIQNKTEPEEEEEKEINFTFSIGNNLNKNQKYKLLLEIFPSELSFYAGAYTYFVPSNTLKFSESTENRYIDLDVLIDGSSMYNRKIKNIHSKSWTYMNVAYFYYRAHKKKGPFHRFRRKKKFIITNRGYDVNTVNNKLSDNYISDILYIENKNKSLNVLLKFKYKNKGLFTIKKITAKLYECVE